MMKTVDTIIIESGNHPEKSKLKALCLRPMVVKRSSPLGKKWEVGSHGLLMKTSLVHHRTLPYSMPCLTLCAHQHHGHLAGISEAAEAQEVVVHCLEADFIFQAKHKHHRVHPGSKLGRETESALTGPMNADTRQVSQKAHHLEFRGASFISDQQQVTLAIHHNLLLKPTP